MGYVYTSKIYFDFLKRIIPHTSSDFTILSDCKTDQSHQQAKRIVTTFGWKLRNTPGVAGKTATGEETDNNQAVFHLMPERNLSRCLISPHLHGPFRLETSPEKEGGYGTAQYGQYGCQTRLKT